MQNESGDRGCGYIGLHACVALLSAGEQVVVCDNFCNSSPQALERVQKKLRQVVRRGREGAGGYNIE
jgi:UDP-glucose 4-epimerase